MWTYSWARGWWSTGYGGPSPTPAAVERGSQPRWSWISVFLHWLYRPVAKGIYFFFPLPMSGFCMVLHPSCVRLSFLACHLNVSSYRLWSCVRSRCHRYCLSVSVKWCLETSQYTFPGGTALYKHVINDNFCSKELAINSWIKWVWEWLSPGEMKN